ncbi:MAG: tetraacyldisaccharide 4'-kinase [Bacteroidaceae bacterium]|nr:tetraacyldisaccharide 4'-kinase [Bacteroidaceae bacterium]MBR4517294.1 tetraacyldisaccharide 4'-kinase [Bacteroidaceae bacterium]
MEGDLTQIRRWLLPLSWFYGLAVDIRNALFDMGVLPSVSYDIPIINVGNITVGGTGKTPHVEYLIRLLSDRYRVAVLSRGYKRKTSGYLLSSVASTIEEIGDEPWQIKQKYPDVYVAVDANRRRGIERLMTDEATKDVEVILLDDAYQHRYVKPGHNILLVDYHRIISDDRLLPAGCLRERPSSSRRATTVIVTKCPGHITAMGFRVILSALHIRPYQQLFFSTFAYGTMRQLWGNGSLDPEALRKENTHVLLLTGIGNPRQMEQDMRRFVQHITPLSFPDHHYYTKRDADTIHQALLALPKPHIIVTTEKDAARLLHLQGLSEEVKRCTYVLPIEIRIMRDEKDKFDKTITSYVQENTSNSGVAP